MADGGEFLLTGYIAGALFQAKLDGSVPMIREVLPLMKDNGLARTVIKVVMPSGTYYVTVTESDARLDDSIVIEEDP